jgi:farnesyl-diphosphate farnesyltransferase
VLAALAAMPAPERSVVALHAVRTCDGMARVVSAGEEGGRVELSSLRELREYCYIVAGIVGELLTDLFVMDAPALAPAAPTLQQHARAFGEGLQLVNILKDATDDARDGRTYLPPTVPREAVLDLARRDLDDAVTYVHALQSHDAPRGFVEFTALPVALARATLDKLALEGPGAKLPRATVMSLAADLDQRLDQGAPALGASSSR